MEGNSPPRNLIPGAPYGGGFNLEAQIQLHHHRETNSGQPFQYAHHLFAENPVQDSGNVCPVARTAVKSLASDEDDADDGHRDRGKLASQWHRVKWTSDMVRLLVSAVSYIDEDVDPDYGGSGAGRKYAMLKKRGKWKLVSGAMTERGFPVSPQQCEDKFNDLNKRYKRLTDILGRGTSCRVVENPALLDAMSISDKLKEDARKILSSKHLHYEEMCSYHNRNRLCLLDDPVLQSSLRAALRSRDEHDMRKGSLDEDADEDDQIALSDEDDDFDDDREISAEANHTRICGTSKKSKLDQEELQFGSSSSLSLHCPGSYLTEGIAIDKNTYPPDMHSLQLQKQQLRIKAEMLKLERRHLKWLKFSKEKDRELEEMRLRNERMKLENERLALELKHKELELGLRPKTIQ